MIKVLYFSRNDPIIILRKLWRKDETPEKNNWHYSNLPRNCYDNCYGCELAGGNGGMHRRGRNGS